MSEEYEDVICPYCNGSGEGRGDRSTCKACKGSGSVINLLHHLSDVNKEESSNEKRNTVS